VFSESTIRSLFDEVLRGLRIVHQHKMLHLDIKPANIFITNDDKAVLIDFGAARKCCPRRTSFVPCTRRALLPLRCTGAIPSWVPGPISTPSAPASMPACRAYRPTKLRSVRTRTAWPGLNKLRGVYSDNLIEVVEWCMAMDPLSRPQSVFALQKELSREGERRYTKLSMQERMRMQFDNMVHDARKNLQKLGGSERGAVTDSNRKP
jgi:serine/threonine protein kinase